jgi:predicted transcriptional regulator
MPPKKLTAFRLGPADLRRLQKLAAKKECSRSQVVRLAIRMMADREGIK